MRENLISYRFAVTVISILLGASAAGWIMTELVPPDFTEREVYYGEQWGDTATRIVRVLRCYDPFHSIWYRTILALFFIVLTLCMVTRWRRFVLRSFRVRIPEGAETLMRRPVRAEIVWSSLIGSDKGVPEMKGGLLDASAMDALFAEAVRYLRSRGYSVHKRREEGGTIFAAAAGRWRFLGSFLFHLGILVVTVGGVAGSFWGGTEFVYGKAGDKLQLPWSGDSLLVEDFRILMTENNEIRDYISSVIIFDVAGDTIAAGDIEVNHPLRHAASNIYQSSYHVVENEFDSALVNFEYTGAGRETVALRYGEVAALGSAQLSVRPLRFLPDFRMGPSGPYSASMTLGNPALEIEVRDSERYERGWLFLNYPRFNSKFGFQIRPRLVSIAPFIFTGLQVSHNPGEHIFMAGIILATAGLALLYLFNHRALGGVIDGRRLLIAGMEFRWKLSFEEEFERMGEALRERFHELLRER
jgi:cytochrome c biogenesis protein